MKKYTQHHKNSITQHATSSLTHHAVKIHVKFVTIHMSSSIIKLQNSGSVKNQTSHITIEQNTLTVS